MSNGTCLAGRGPQRQPVKEEFWRATMHAFAASGQSVRGFCRARQLSEPSFHAWRRTLARRDARPAAASPEAPAFMPIRLVEHEGPVAMAAPIELVLPGGVRIGLHPPVDRQALRDILAALEGPASTPSSPASVEA